jgi:hypothetical protein
VAFLSQPATSTAKHHSVRIKLRNRLPSVCCPRDPQLERSFPSLYRQPAPNPSRDDPVVAT